MTQITLGVPTPYNVYTGSNILSFSAEEINRLSQGRKLLILSDTTVFPLYGEKLKTQLALAGFECFTLCFEAGEGSKTPESLVNIWHCLAQREFTRADGIVSLGGGVIGDLGGFAASTYMRGISHYIFPTTLLAMCDAGIGGKTAVNLPEGKNLAGTFYAPRGVFCDTDFLSTLPREIYSDGMAEVIKYGLIGSASLLDMLKVGVPDEKLVELCAEAKKYYVEADEKDRGLRQHLNFGHTLAHSAESLSKGEISHGRAVAAGMYLTTRAAVKQGLCSEDVLKIQEELFEKYSLPKALPFSVEMLCKTAAADKKRTDNFIHIIIPVAKGKSERIKLPLNGLIEFFSSAYDT